jgi:hypothetical protein
MILPSEECAVPSVTLYLCMCVCMLCIYLSYIYIYIYICTHTHIDRRHACTNCSGALSFTCITYTYMQQATWEQLWSSEGVSEKVPGGHCTVYVCICGYVGMYVHRSLHAYMYVDHLYCVNVDGGPCAVLCLCTCVWCVLCDATSRRRPGSGRRLYIKRISWPGITFLEHGWHSPGPLSPFFLKQTGTEECVHVYLFAYLRFEDALAIYI